MHSQMSPTLDSLDSSLGTAGLAASFFSVTGAPRGIFVTPNVEVSGAAASSPHLSRIGIKEPGMIGIMKPLEVV